MNLQNILNKSNILILIFFLFFFSINNTFENGYIILKNSYEVRLIKYYGFCEKTGYGFIKKYSSKYNFRDNAKIINHDTNYSSSGWMIEQFNQPKVYNYIIHLNSPTNKFNEDILESEYNCFILKNDRAS